MTDPNTVIPLCGIDEAGRGPLAGPVTAAAVVLHPGLDRSILADSKTLSPKRREEVERAIIDAGCVFALGWVDASEIDEINIHNAALEAMTRAYNELKSRYIDLAVFEPFETLVDGRFSPPSIPNCRAVVGGDGRVPEIMAASILAKNARDRFMIRYHESDRRYGFAQNKGYPTPTHRRALREHGPCPIHRRTFRGVAGTP